MTVAAVSRVVLLGAGGFIGRALRRALDARGTALLAPGSREIDLASAGCIEPLAALLRADDCIVMLSALTPDKGRDIATLMTNLAMVQHLCAAVSKSGCGHLVYISSDAVYDGTLAHVSEHTPTSPRDLYGSMHRTREVMLESLGRVPRMILRPTGVYGPGDTHNAYGPNRFLKMAAQEGRIALFGGGEEMRDHVQVDDVAALTVRCIDDRATGVLNIVTGTSTSFRDVSALVAKQFDKPVEIAASPRANAITHRHYDLTALIRRYPDFRFTPLADGIAGIAAGLGAGNAGAA